MSSSHDLLHAPPKFANMQTLYALARVQGVAITETQQTPDKPLAYYSPTKHTIYIQEGLPLRQQRYLLAHELGHVFYGHATNSPKAERQADAFAAMQLIDPIEYQRVEEAYGTNENVLAYELGVTPHVIRVWRDCIERSTHETRPRSNRSCRPHPHRMRRKHTHQNR